MLQRNCSLVVYLAALKARSLSHTHIIKKDLRGFLYGKESKKAPGLLKSNANHFINMKRQTARPGANTLCHGLTFFLLSKK